MEENTFPVAYIYSSADVIVTKEPAYLLASFVVSDNVGQADATLYNGVNTNGHKIHRLNAVQGGDRWIEYPAPGIPCPNGIYLDVGSSVAEVFIAYRRM